MGMNHRMLMASEQCVSQLQAYSMALKEYIQTELFYRLLERVGENSGSFLILTSFLSSFFSQSNQFRDQFAVAAPSPFATQCAPTLSPPPPNFAADAPVFPTPSEAMPHRDKPLNNSLKSCCKCGRTQTTQWRRGPLGVLYVLGLLFSQSE